MTCKAAALGCLAQCRSTPDAGRPSADRARKAPDVQRHAAAPGPTSGQPGARLSGLQGADRRCAGCAGQADRCAEDTGLPALLLPALACVAEHGRPGVTQANPRTCLAACCAAQVSEDMRPVTQIKCFRERRSLLLLSGMLWGVMAVDKLNHQAHDDFCSGVNDLWCRRQRPTLTSE